MALRSPRTAIEARFKRGGLTIGAPVERRVDDGGRRLSHGAAQTGGALLGPSLLAVRSSMAAILQGQDSGILFAASITT